MMTCQKAKTQPCLGELGEWPRRLREPACVRIVAPTLGSRAQCKLPMVLPVSRETRFGAAACCRAPSAPHPCKRLGLERKGLRTPPLCRVNSDLKVKELSGAMGISSTIRGLIGSSSVLGCSSSRWALPPLHQTSHFPNSPQGPCP